jgi:hypothetical protein
MNRYKHIIFMVLFFLCTMTQKSIAETLVKCGEGSTLTGGEFNVIGGGDKFLPLRYGPGNKFEKIINQTATSMSTVTQYIELDDSVVINEECIKNGYSLVRVINYDYLKDSHYGWVESKFLDKGQSIDNSNKYSREIPSYVLEPYNIKEYPKTVQKYKSRLKEIELLRKKAAIMVVDSGKCDQIIASEVDTDSPLKSLRFYVDCKGYTRFYLTESEILKDSLVRTQKEKAWTPDNAIASCKQGIKDRALIPSDAEIHDIIGTTFSEAPVTHNVVVTMNFEAKNAFGIKIPYKATCHFEPGILGTIDISLRK